MSPDCSYCRPRSQHGAFGIGLHVDLPLPQERANPAVESDSTDRGIRSRPTGPAKSDSAIGWNPIPPPVHGIGFHLDSIFYFPIPWRAAGGWQMRTPEEPTLRNAVEGVYEPQMSLESILEIFWPSSAGRGRRRDLSCTQRARIGEIWRLSSLTDVSSLSFVKLEQAIRCALRRSQQRTSLEAQ